MKMLYRVLTLLFCLVLTACGNSDPGQPFNPALRSVIFAQFGHVFVYMPLYVAVDQGFFKDEGLDPALISTGGDEKTFAAVASGNAHFGVSDPTFTAIAREHGQGGKVVAFIVKGVPLSVVSFKDLKPFQDPAGFSGKKIAAYSSPSTSYTVLKQILENKGHPVKATIVEGAFGTLQAMVKSNQADMSLEVEPMVSTAVAEHGHIVFEVNTMYPEFAFTGLMVADQFAKDHADEVQSVVRAINRGLQYIQTNPEGAVQVAKKEFPELPPDVVKKAVMHLISEGNIPKTAVLDKVSWDNAIKLRKESGDLKGAGSFEENVDNSFAENALKSKTN